MGKQHLESLRTFIRHHNDARDRIRIGQRFVNFYIKNPWPELFYEEEEGRAIGMIREWLIDHQYIDKLPEKIKYSELVTQKVE